MTPLPPPVRVFIRRHRTAVIAASSWLGLLTVLAILPFDPQGPFDARDYSRPPGIYLEQAWWGALVEPIAAPGHILAGAPDMRVAVVVTLIWFCLATAGWRIGVARRQKRHLGVSVITIGGFTLAAAGTFGAVLVYSLLVRLPSWRLVTGDPHAVVADLQSHTLGSHDGLISARTNLAWHAAHGYTVVAVTEHNKPAGSFAAHDLARANSSKFPSVIPGVEVRSGIGGYLLGLGLDSAVVLPREVKGWDRAAMFTEKVHTAHQGAVLALAWKLDPQSVVALADAGIDGFEIANFGHPDIPRETSDAIRDACRSRGLALVASSDWHGWGGFARTWTVFSNARNSDLVADRRAEFVVEKLRARAISEITPVIAGSFEKPSLLRVMFAPVAETIRYGMELSPLRLAGWWLWVAATLGLVHLFSGLHLRPRRILFAGFLVMVGLSVIWSGGALLAAWAAEPKPSPYAFQIATIALLVGFLSTGAGLFIAWRAHRRRARVYRLTS